MLRWRRSPPQDSIRDGARWSHAKGAKAKDTAGLGQDPLIKTSTSWRCCWCRCC